MGSSFRRLVAFFAVMLAASLTFSGEAFAASTVSIHDPLTDTVQLWSEIANAITSVTQQIAALVPPTSLAFVAPTASTPAPVGPPPGGAAAAAAAVIAPQPVSPVTTSSSPTASVAAAPIPTPTNTGIGDAPSSPPATAANSVTSVAQAPSDSFLSSRVNSLITIVGNLASIVPGLINQQPQTTPTSQQILGDGNPGAIAAGFAVNNLSGVTITNANLSAAEIPSLSYLPLSGGTVSGSTTLATLNAGASSLATTTITGDLNVSGNINGTFSAATSSAVSFSAINLTATNATTTNLFATTASSTNLYSTNASFASLAGAAFTSLSNNYLAKWNGGTWGKSVVYDNGTNIGVGTTSLSNLLTVGASNTTYGTGSSYGLAISGGNPSKHLDLGYDNTINAGVIASEWGGNPWQNTVINPSGGNVGIGTTSPVYKLDINGTARGSLYDLGGGTYNVQAYGAKGDGVTDDTLAIQAALNAAHSAGGGTVYLPPTGHAYLITNTLTVSNGVMLMGAETKTFAGTEGTTAQWTANGTWLDIASSTIPAVALSGHGSGINGIDFIGLNGAQWNPIPTEAWTVLVTADAFSISNVLILNRANGINVQYSYGNGGGTYSYISNVWFSCYQVGLALDKVNDNLDLNELHFRNIVGMDQNTAVNYGLNNYIAMEMGDYDNPAISNIDIFAAHIGMYFYNDAAISSDTPHSLVNATVSNLGFNLVDQAMVVASATTTVTGQFSNVMAQGAASALGSVSLNDTLFWLRSDAVNVRFSNFSVPDTGGAVMELGNGATSGARAIVDGAQIYNWSNTSTSTNAFIVYPSAQLTLGANDINATGHSAYTTVGTGAVVMNPLLTDNGSQNVSDGLFSLTSVTTGTANAAVGYRAGQGLTSTNGSVAAFGAYAMQNHSGNQNTAIGAFSLNGSGSGFNNTVLGFQAGNSDTSGAKNLFIGWNTASSTQTGTDNIALGYDVGLPSINGSNQLNIGNLIYGTGVNGEGSAISTGNIGVGTTTPWGRLSITGVDTSSATPALLATDANNNSLLAVMDNGDVGIGKSFPSYSLDVGGFVNVDGTLGGYKQAGNTILFASSTSALTSGGIGSLGNYFNLTSTAGETAFGYQALANATSSVSDTAVGYQALKGSATISSTGANTALGYLALTAITNGNQNTAVGSYAGQALTTNGAVTVLGYAATQNHTGNQNTAIGALSLNGSGNGFNNTVLGFQAGNSDTSGAKNLFAGWNAASSTQTGTDNIALGYDVGLPSINGSNQLSIGNLIYGTGINGEGATISTGNIGIGTTTPYSRLEVWGPDTASTTAFSVVNSASTTVFAAYDSGNATYSGSIFQSSDQRLKTNITDLDASTSLALVDQLNPVSYTRIDEPDLGTNLGFIAQQVQQIFPELVSTSSPTALTPDGTLTLNYQGLISPLVKAVQALSNEITSLQNTVAGFADSFTTSELSYNRADGNTTSTQTLCLTDGPNDQTPICITKAQLASILVAENVSSAAESFSTNNASTASTTIDIPPVIQINGNNPATIQVGTPYTDLGASITGPTADLNLDINTFVNGAPMNPVQIDTSAVATDTIDYVVTDQNDLTSTSTRTVIIEAATSSVSE